MKKILTTLLCSVLLTSSAYPAAKQGTKKVAVVKPSTGIVDNIYAEATIRDVDIMYDQATTMLEAHNIPYVVKTAALNESGWVSRNSLDNTNRDTNIGAVLIIGAIVSNPWDSPNTYSYNMAPLYEAFDTDSINVPILAWYQPSHSPYGGNYRDAYVDIGLNSAMDYPQNTAIYRLDYGYRDAQRIHNGYTNDYESFEYYAFSSDDGNDGDWYYSLIDTTWAGNGTYGMTSVSPVAWIGGTTTSPSDSCIVFDVLRGDSGRITFAHLGTSAHYNKNFAGMQNALIPLLIRLDPNIYYETLEHVIVMDDCGMPGMAGLVGNQAQNRNGITAADMTVMGNDFREFGFKALLAPDPAHIWRGDGLPTDPVLYAAGTGAVVTLRTPNDGKAQMLELSKYKDVFNVSKGWHVHDPEFGIAKGNGAANIWADAPIDSLYDEWHEVWKAVYDSVGWNWSEGSPLQVFPGDAFHNSDAGFIPRAEPNTFDEMMSELSTTGEIRAIRVGSGYGAVLPEDTASQLEDAQDGNGVMVMTMLNIIAYSESYYADFEPFGATNVLDDSLFVNTLNATDSTNAMASEFRGTRATNGLGKNNGYWGIFYEYASPNNIGMSGENNSYSHTGGRSNFKSPYETWHHYNWDEKEHVVTGQMQRKGQGWIRMVGAMHGFVDHLSGVNDLYAYTFGERFYLKRQNFRTSFDFVNTR